MSDFEKSADDESMQNYHPGGKKSLLTLTYRIYMCEIIFKACMRSYLVG